MIHVTRGGQCALEQSIKRLPGGVQHEGKERAENIYNNQDTMVAFLSRWILILMP